MAVSVTVFIRQPRAGPILAPVDAQVQLHCSVTDSYGVDWNVTLPDRSTVATDQRFVEETLLKYGIEVVGLTSQRSTLKIRLNGTNNGTVVACIAIRRGNPLQKCFSKRVKIIFYGELPTPSLSNDLIHCSLYIWLCQVPHHLPRV